MQLLWMACTVSVIFSTSAIAQSPQVPPSQSADRRRRLALARGHASKTPLYSATLPTLSLMTLRKGFERMVCTASRPGDTDFDVRCYHESFIAVVRRLRELHSQGVNDDEIDRIIDAEIKAKKVPVPDHPTAGYRMLGPISAYQPATNTANKEIRSWQSVHFPYKLFFPPLFRLVRAVDRSRQRQYSDCLDPNFELLLVRPTSRRVEVPFSPRASPVEEMS